MRVGSIDSDHVRVVAADASSDVFSLPMVGYIFEPNTLLLLPLTVCIDPTPANTKRFLPHGKV